MSQIEPRVTHDVSQLPRYGFGTRMTTWWGGTLLIAIEGAALALAAAAYLYLAWLNPSWPLASEPPGLLWSSLLTILLIAMVVPAMMAERAATEENLPRVKLLLVVLNLINIGVVGLRVMEFTTLNIWWDSNAYGSLVWFILGVHTTHIAADAIDTAFVTALLFTGHDTGKRLSLVEDDALFIYFIVAAWLPIYGLLYWFPRVWSP